MRHRLVQVLSGEERDEAAREVLRRFWVQPVARAGSLGVRSEGRPPAGVVDLAQWARANAKARPDPDLAR